VTGPDGSHRTPRRSTGVKNITDTIYNYLRDTARK